MNLLKKSCLTIIVLGLLTGTHLTAYIVGFLVAEGQPVYQRQSFQPPTGEDVWNEINRYRIANGKEPFEKDGTLCRNIVERYFQYANDNPGDNSHRGLDEFRSENKMPFQLTELFVSGSTAAEMVKNWSTSPPHNAYLLGEVTHITHGCTYSANYKTVLLLR